MTTTWEDSAVIQVTDDGSLGQDDKSRGGKWLESRYVLKVETKGFIVKSDMECTSKRGVAGDSKIFGLSEWPS